MPTSLSPKEVATRWFGQVWNERAENLICELLADDAIGHLEGGVEAKGCDGFKAFQQAILETFPDIKVNILRVMGEGQEACVLWEATATHSGAGMGMAPTGKPVYFTGTSWFRVVDGKIAEGWDSWNQGGLVASLGS